MKNVTKWMFILSMLLICSYSFASIGVQSEGNVLPPAEKPGGGSSFDETCIIDYVGLVNGGGNSGTVNWPDGQYGNAMGLMKFTNDCTPGELFYAYCFDITHILFADPYCVDIENQVIDPLYPEQFMAMGYLMTWYPSNTQLEDDIMQLSIWKLSNELDESSPNFGIPYYHVDAGWGYPELGDPAVYPYVNTLHHDDSALNEPANLQLLDALGVSDGIVKNVIMDGDMLTVMVGEPVIVGGDAIVPVTIQLTRGANALAIGNVFLGGVKLLVSVNGGELSASEVFTDEFGQAEVTVTQALASPDVSIEVCSYGLWPKSVLPCDATETQEFITGAVDTVCTDGYIDWPLPVELTSFEAVSGTDYVELSWATASENDNDYFKVYRRNAGSWQEIARLQSNGNNSLAQTYTYRDSEIIVGVSYDYMLADVDLSGVETLHDGLIQTASAVNAFVPHESSLHQNYPNPFNPETHISYDIMEAGIVTLKIYSLTGREVATLVSGEKAAGHYTVTFSATDLPSGVYMYRLDVNDFTAMKKMILLK